MVLGRRLRQWLARARPTQASRFTFDRCAVLLSAFAFNVLDILFGPRSLRLLLARRLKRLLLHEAADPNLYRPTLPELAQLGLLLPHERRA